MVLWTNMAKARGTESQGHDPTKLTISVRRRHRNDVEKRIGVDSDIDNELQKGFRDDEQVDYGEGFFRGPYNMPLLVNFVDHVVFKLWEGDIRTKKPSINFFFVNCCLN